MASDRKEAPRVRRERALYQLDLQRAEIMRQWWSLESGVHIQERRVVGVVRGFRAALPFATAIGTIWMIRRRGVARVIRQAMVVLAAWRAVRRVLPRRFPSTRPYSRPM